MAIKTKLTCSVFEDDFITAESNENNNVYISGECESIPFELELDISTAIRFAKMIRTEINKSKKQSEL